MGLYELGVTFPESRYHISPFPNDTPGFLYWPGKMSFSFMNIYLHSFLRLFRIFLPHPYFLVL